MSLYKAEIAMAGAAWHRKDYNITEKLSSDKKPTMIYYVSPKPHTYGYFSTTLKSNVDSWFEDNVRAYTKQTRNLIWC